LLQLVQGHQKGFEGAIGQRLGRFVLLVLLKSVQPLRLVDALGLVAKEHGVAVKSDAHLVRMRRAGVRRLRVDLRGRHTGAQGGAHVAQVGAQK